MLEDPMNKRIAALEASQKELLEAIENSEGEGRDNFFLEVELAEITATLEALRDV